MDTIDLALRFIFTIVAIMFTALFFIFIYDYATQNTYFSITKISIHGLNRLTENQALEQAGLHPGDTLLNINAFKIKKRLVAHPWIKAAEVTRQPPHTLGISIMEEIPLARVDMGIPPSLLINAQGIPFTMYAPETFALDMKLPVIKGLSLEKNKEGLFGFYGSLYRDILSLLTNDFGAPITAITADNATGIAVETHFRSQEGSGQPVAPPTTLKLGFSQFRLKFNTAGKIFHYLQQQGTPNNIATMDLFNPERVIVTPGRHAPGADITGGA